MIKIVNYGCGNVKAFLNCYKRLGYQAEAASSADELIGAKKIILPGVGSFDYAMSKLNSSGMRDGLERLVFDQKVPVLGICVGMQMLAERSEEGSGEGLCWIKGKVRHLSNLLDSEKHMTPHMGWNKLEVTEGQESQISITKGGRFYFLHSYYMEVTDTKSVYAVTRYGKKFTAAIAEKNIFGVQCHPEKSHADGLALLQKFGEI